MTSLDRNYSGDILRRDASCGTINLTPSPVKNGWEGEAPAEPWLRDESKCRGSTGISPSPKERAKTSGRAKLRLSRGRRQIEMSRLDGSLALPKGARENRWEGEAYAYQPEQLLWINESERS